MAIYSRRSSRSSESGSSGQDAKNDDDNFPPGTVRLLSSRKGNVSDKVIPIPAPSGDANDPLGWPMWRKVANFTLLSIMTLALTSGSGIQTLFWSQMSKDLGITTGQLLTAKALNQVGEAVTCLFFIAFAKKYGRRSTYVISTTVFTAAIWWTAYLQTVPEVYITNILKGLSGAINKTAVQMSIRDMFFVHQRGTANSAYFISTMAGISITPLAAGAQATATGWRSSYITFAIFMTVFTILLMLCYEETKFVRPSDASVELEKQGSNSNSSSSSMRFFDQDGQAEKGGAAGVSTRTIPAEKPTSSFPHYLRLQFITRTNENFWKTVYQPFYSLPIPQVLVASVIFGVDWNFLHSVSSMKSIIFSAAPYHFTPFELGLLNLAPFVGTAIGTVYGGWVVDRAIMRLARRNGNIFEPEMRLYFLPLPAVLLLVGHIVYGTTADQGMNWIYPALGYALLATGFTAMSNIVLTHIIDCYPDITALTFPIITFFKTSFSIIGAFTLDSWRHSMSVSAMFCIAAGVGLAAHTLIIPLIVWGKRARAANAERYRCLARDGGSKDTKEGAFPAVE